ncbi:MAG: transcriptional regulator [Thermoleophilia bacterium]
MNADPQHAPELTGDEARIERLATALGDPTRRRVFFAVRESGEALSKDDVAKAVGIERRLAGFHLDKLVDHGFLTAEFHRRSGRSGPGAGRPAKHYRLAEEEQEVALPERHYDVLASLLLKAASDDSGRSSDEVLEQVGYDFGYQMGLAEAAEGRTRPGREGVDAVAEVVRLLSRYGFAAKAEGEGTIRACACPFEELALADPDRICGLDRAIWKGILAAFDGHATLSVGATRARGDDACVAEIVGS